MKKKKKQKKKIKKKKKREKIGFIGRNKRTIWMGLPSLHPTYSNSIYIVQAHFERILSRI